MWLCAGGLKNNSNNKQICIAPERRNVRGAGARQRVSEQRKKRNPGTKRSVFSLDLKTATESLLKTVCGGEFQAAGAEHRKARFANVVVA